LEITASVDQPDSLNPRIPDVRASTYAPRAPSANAMPITAPGIASRS